MRVDPGRRSRIQHTREFGKSALIKRRIENKDLYEIHAKRIIKKQKTIQNQIN